MRIFVVGDYYSGTGPANVTKAYIDNLPKDTLYQKCKNKLLRLIEMFIKINQSDVVFISGYSKQNLYAIKMAKMRGIKAAYLVHGSIEYENEINGVTDLSMNKVEMQTLLGSDLLLAVSVQFAEFLKNRYPQLSDKISYLINGVDYGLIPTNNVGSRAENRIISIGGGMPRKRIVNICKAIRLLNEEGMNIKLVVAGDKGLDSDEINSYSFVENLGIIEHSKLMEELQKAHIFVQNSCFETFGLAPIEALVSGCDILMSKECGALSLFDNKVLDTDIINDTDNITEIADKIRYLMINPNHERLYSNIDMESTSWEYRSVQLQNILKNLAEKE